MKSVSADKGKQVTVEKSTVFSMKTGKEAIQSPHFDFAKNVAGITMNVQAVSTILVEVGVTATILFGLFRVVFLPIWMGILLLLHVIMTLIFRIKYKKNEKQPI